MPKRKPQVSNPLKRVSRPALSRNGRIATKTGRVPEVLQSSEQGADFPWLANAELVQLQVRMIALEQLVVVLLCEASEQQKTLALELARTISPRPSFTPHRLTRHAVAQMNHLVGRASRFETGFPQNPARHRVPQ